MNTYAITFLDHTENEVAETAGKAKYNFFLNHDLSELGYEFGGFIKSVECKLVRKFHIHDLFTQNIREFERMKEARGIEFAHLGMRVEINGKPGVIVGSNSSMNLDVCMDGSTNRCNCHPWWRIKYFDNYGKVIREYGD